MRILDSRELEQVSGGARGWQKVSEEQRAAPATDVTPDPNLPGNRTGWCRGYGNMKMVDDVVMYKHAGTNCAAV